jgi:hypothetical protein
LGCVYRRIVFLLLPISLLFPIFPVLALRGHSRGLVKKRAVWAKFRGDFTRYDYARTRSLPCDGMPGTDV